MILNLFKKKHYFFVIPLDSAAGDEIISKEIYKKIRTYFKWRNRDVEYVEPYSMNKDYKTYLVVGTATKKDIEEQKNLGIFLLELYAHITDSTIPVTEDFPKEEMTIGNKQVTLYTIIK